MNANQNASREQAKKLRALRKELRERQANLKILVDAGHGEHAGAKFLRREIMDVAHRIDDVVEHRA